MTDDETEQLPYDGSDDETTELEALPKSRPAGYHDSLRKLDSDYVSSQRSLS